MTSFAYTPYIGPDGFVFLRVFGKDKKLGLDIAEKLLQRKFRVFYDRVNDNAAEDTAAGILNCSIALFVINEEAVNNLDMRNSINFALKEKKRTIIIKDKNFIPGHGLDMQLANVESVDRNKDIISQLDNLGVLTDELKGEGMLYREKNRQKTISMIVLGSLIVLLMIGSLVFLNRRVRYLNSAAYILKDADGSDYLDISMFDEEALYVLKDKNIGTLNMEGMDLKDISMIKDIRVKEVNIAHNPNVSSLYFISECAGIERVIISRDMLKYARDLLNKGIEVRVVN